MDVHYPKRAPRQTRRKAASFTPIYDKFYTYLRQGKRKRRKRYGSTERRGQIPDRRSIDERPKVVDQRNRIGDWESDSVVGKSSASSIATHVERKSRYLVACKLADQSASMNQATIKSFRKIEIGKIKTMTFDNGKEFAGFKELEKALETKTYFAKPNSLFQSNSSCHRLWVRCRYRR